MMGFLSKLFFPRLTLVHVCDCQAADQGGTIRENGGKASSQGHWSFTNCRRNHSANPHIIILANKGGAYGVQKAETSSPHQYLDRKVSPEPSSQKCNLQASDPECSL